MFGSAELVIQGDGQRSEVVSGVSLLVKTDISLPFSRLKEAGEERNRAAGFS